MKSFPEQPAGDHTEKRQGYSCCSVPQYEQKRQAKTDYGTAGPRDTIKQAAENGTGIS